VSEEFKNRLLVHARTVVDRAGRAQSEEATKQFLILPFLQLLGYDPLDPDEVIPEADASFSDKFKNRVDYAISKEGIPVIAVEAKKVGSLSEANRGELKGYYNAVPTVKHRTRKPDGQRTVRRRRSCARSSGTDRR
jgi:predicted type IV restriction endonuclease